MWQKSNHQSRRYLPLADTTDASFRQTGCAGIVPAGHGAGAPSAANRSAVRVAVGDFTHLDRAGVPRRHSHKNIVSKTLVREGLQVQSLDLQVPQGAVAAIEDDGVLGEQLPLHSLNG